MLDLIRNRRSARKFDGRPIPTELIDLLGESLLRSPTSKNNRPWEFIFVDDPTLLAHLAVCKPHGATFLKEAPLAVVIVADEKASDVWVEDCSIAAITLQYVAQSLDLGSCWIQVRKRFHDSGDSAEAVVRRTLEIPDHFRVASIVALGYRREERTGVPKEKLDYQKIKLNRYS
ncbi:MAG: nitroreductase family protein [Deltaproteobacteria bacterium]|nr:nitroreductase family protein [Deltaproteobacteria bacterium]